MKKLPPISVLDLCPVPEGSDARDAFRNTLELARHAEKLGYLRYWIAEHHGMSGVAGAATSLVIQHVAAGTSTIRVGAGGIMLPNHAPLVVAEQFGTLATLFPGRIDLGLGRAPGTDARTAHALRRTREGSVDDFADEVAELQAYFADRVPGVRAVPGAGLEVPLYVLGSSLFGASLAAALGLPFAFASHFAPQRLDEALALYRDRFRPSSAHAEPYAIVAVNVFAAETDAEAESLFTSLAQAFRNLMRGTPGKLPAPVARLQDALSPSEIDALDSMLRFTVRGTPARVREGLEALAARTRADELIVAAQIFEPRARLRSFELVAEVAKA
jgi:luciferase family oxidoreductase group 1